MGGGADRLALARRLALDALPLVARADREGRARRLLLLALASLLVRGGEHMALLGRGHARRPRAAPRSRRSPRSSRAPRRRPGPSDRRLSSLPPFQLLPRHAQLVLIGDFLSPLEEFESLVRRYAARGVRGHVLQVLDPAEETLPFGGRMRFEGFENEGEVLIRRVEHARGDYLDRLAAHQGALAAVVRRIGWQFDRHRTDRLARERALGSLHGPFRHARRPTMRARGQP